jgi:hypothetical protein
MSVWKLTAKALASASPIRQPAATTARTPIRIRLRASPAASRLSPIRALVAAVEDDELGHGRHRLDEHRP